MADDRERSRSPERGDEGAAPAPAPAADDYPAPAPAADNDTGGDANGAAAANGATDDSVKLYVGNLHYGTTMSRELCLFSKHTQDYQL